MDFFEPSLFELAMAGDPLSTTNAVAVFTSAIQAASNDIDIKAFEKNSDDRYTNTVQLEEWLEQFQRKLARKKNLTPEEKRDFLLDKLSEKARNDYRTTTAVTDQADAYENCKATLKKAIGIPNTESEATRMFHALVPKHGESALPFIRKCKEIALMAKFTNASEAVMNKALAMCYTDKFQERATSANWTSANLAEAEDWLIKQEQLLIRKKQIRDQFDPASASNIKAIQLIKCPNCYREHPSDFCSAKGKQCYRCNELDHFSYACPNSTPASTTTNGPTNVNRYVQPQGYQNQQPRPGYYNQQSRPPYQGPYNPRPFARPPYRPQFRPNFGAPRSFPGNQMPRQPSPNYGRGYNYGPPQRFGPRGRGFAANEFQTNRPQGFMGSARGRPGYVRTVGEEDFGQFEGHYEDPTAAGHEEYYDPYHGDYHGDQYHDHQSFHHPSDEQPPPNPTDLPHQADQHPTPQSETQQQPTDPNDSVDDPFYKAVRAIHLEPF